MESMQSQTIQLTLPKSDIKMLKKLASGMGWVVSAMSSKKKSGIEKGLEDIRNGNVYHGKEFSRFNFPNTRITHCHV